MQIACINKYSGSLHAREDDSEQCFTGFSQDRRLMINQK